MDQQAYKKIEKSLNHGAQNLTTSRSHSKRLALQKTAKTKPELIVRKSLRDTQICYRVNNKDLPGSPDLANRKRLWAIFVHGCYWHAHQGCAKATLPKANREFWLAKFSRNKQRDSENEQKLRKMGFRVFILWECEVQDPGTLSHLVKSIRS